MPALSNPKHESFAQALARGMPYTKAYIFAGFKESQTNALKLSKTAPVNTRVQELLGTRLMEAETRSIERIEATVERTLLETARLAFSDIRNVVKWDAEGKVTVTPSDQLSDAAAASIQEVRQGKDGAVYVKLYNKQPAIDAIGKSLGLWQDQGNRAADSDQPLTTLEAARRLAFLLASAKEEQKRQMRDVTPDASGKSSG